MPFIGPDPATRIERARQELACGDTEQATAHALVAIAELLLELAQDERVSDDDRDPYVRPL
jgi:hypothetical protein